MEATVVSTSTMLPKRKLPAAPPIRELVWPPKSLKITSSDEPGAPPPSHLLESDQLPAPSTTALVLPFQINPDCSVKKMWFVTGRPLVSLPLALRLRV